MNERLSVELKGLKRQKDALTQKRDAFIAERHVLDNAIIDTNKKLNKVNQDIHKCEMANKDITISDHAIVRYLERVYKIDMEQIKKEILPDNVQETIKGLGNGTYPIGNDLKIKVKNNNVLTVLN